MLPLNCISDKCLVWFKDRFHYKPVDTTRETVTTAT